MPLESQIGQIGHFEHPKKKLHPYKQKYNPQCYIHMSFIFSY